MATEIERKFLVKKELWHPTGEGIPISQGYLSSVPECTVRVRIMGKKSYLTIKGKNEGVMRAEFEYEIPLEDGEALMEMCRKPVISKERYLEHCGGFLWEVDVFHGDNSGLILAEIELPSEDTEFSLPEWAGEEVSHDERYYNSNLRNNPFNKWIKT